MDDINEVKETLCAKFDLKDLGLAQKSLEWRFKEIEKRVS